MDTANLQIRISTSGAPRAERDLNRLERQAGRTERASDGMEQAFKSAGAAIGAYFSVQAVMGILNTADSFNLLQKRVERLSDSSEDAAEKYEELTDIAVESGTDLKTVIGLWENLSRTLGEMGKSDADVLQLTETLNKLGVIGASSTEEIASSMRQFGQAMAGGVLRAEEFNSVMESTPEVARALAEGLGMSMGELRQAMNDGALTADVVFNALMSQTDSINAEFDKMPRTIAQASEALRTNFGNAVAELDQKIGASTGFVKFLDSLAESAERFGESVKLWDLNSAKSELGQLNIELQKQQALVDNLQKTVDAGGFGGVFAQGKLEDEAEKLDAIKQKVSEARALVDSEQKKLIIETELVTTTTTNNNSNQTTTVVSAPDTLSADEKRAEERAARELEIQQEQSAQWLENVRQRIMSEEELLYEKENKDLETLNSYRDQKLLSEQEYLDAALAINQNYTEEHAALNAERAENDKSTLQSFIEDAESKMGTFEGMWGNVFSNFTSGFADATADAIVDGDNFGDAMAGIAKGLAKNMIAALVEIGAQKLVLAALEKTLGLTSATGYVAAITSEATAQTAMAGLNAFAATAAIPIVGPGLAPAAAAAATATAAPFAAAAISAAAGGLAGARSHGGQVVGGASYLVGEFGPEVLTMPSGKSGSITPNHQLNGGATNTVTLSPSIVVESGASQSDDAFLAENISAQVFNMILQDINNGGVLSRSLRR